jgi:hypothetical protein
MYTLSFMEGGVGLPISQVGVKANLKRGERILL